MSNDHPLEVLFKIELPETTLYAYKAHNARIEVTVSHASEFEWFLTVRVITPMVDGCVNDVLWKYNKTATLEVDWAFSWLISNINSGINILELTQDLFIAGWGCAILDELKPQMLEN